MDNFTIVARGTEESYKNGLTHIVCDVLAAGLFIVLGDGGVAGPAAAVALVHL